MGATREEYCRQRGSNKAPRETWLSVPTLRNYKEASVDRAQHPQRRAEHRQKRSQGQSCGTFRTHIRVCSFTAVRWGSHWIVLDRELTGNDLHFKGLYTHMLRAAEAVWVEAEELEKK